MVYMHRASGADMGGYDELAERRGVLAWLGEDHGFTGEQVERLVAESAVIAARYPDVDDTDEREAALSAAARYLHGDLDVTSAGAQLWQARTAAARALAGARQVARMRALDGAAKATTAREAGIDRMTLLKDLGLR
jgi:hypothetical protein